MKQALVWSPHCSKKQFGSAFIFPPCAAKSSKPSVEENSEADRVARSAAASADGTGASSNDEETASAAAACGSHDDGPTPLESAGGNVPVVQAGGRPKGGCSRAASTATSVPSSERRRELRLEPTIGHNLSRRALVRRSVVRVRQASALGGRK